jgi:hypothetical protein
MIHFLLKSIVPAREQVNDTDQLLLRVSKCSEVLWAGMLAGGIGSLLLVVALLS